MLGHDFARTMRAARAGDDDAFARLWRDANPTLVRYLRVVGHDDPYDGACEAWVGVVRALPDFDGDEGAWWVLLLSRARMRAQEGTLRRAWGSIGDVGAGVPAQVVDGDLVDPIDLDDLDKLGPEEQWRGALSDALSAMRDLPLGQGEVLLLRLAAGLSVSQTGLVADLDEVAVRRLEDRGLDRLAVDRELLAWSLAAPVTPGELADERVVLGRYRALGLTPAPDRDSALLARARRAPRAGEQRTRSGSAARGAAAVARRSRSAVVALAALSTCAVSLGGLSAAAYVGVLPDPVQEVMHRAVGAPAPPTAPPNRDTPGQRAPGPAGASHGHLPPSGPAGRSTTRGSGQQVTGPAPSPGSGAPRATAPPQPQDATSPPATASPDHSKGSGKDRPASTRSTAPGPGQGPTKTPKPVRTSKPAKTGKPDTIAGTGKTGKTAKTGKAGGDGAASQGSTAGTSATAPAPGATTP
ncbi:RNA polymerase sigma factor [Knoellia koreensis]|uniref:DNA-directed RNA polymerase specialized sigma24 family protein n=1 Tax=Knoellia koreensis TaxID=2730921 RepID=A0A849HBQ1_9MICO|nr:hypothetical protein [Knoellia sp. DB2414S]NNM45365.1 hypothetical protein [Knoellia sp. DB2414S]